MLTAYSPGDRARRNILVCSPRPDAITRQTLPDKFKSAVGFVRLQAPLSRVPKNNPWASAMTYQNEKCVRHAHGHGRQVTRAPPMAAGKELPLQEEQICDDYLKSCWQRLVKQADPLRTKH